MAKQPVEKNADDEKVDAKEDNPTCGLIMPISAMPPDYEASHWVDVRQILEEAICSAGMKPQMVSDSDETDIIQRRIIHNLYDNPVVVCDISGLNPNVMFELGMRITFKRPVVIVTDTLKRVPFDTSIIEYLPYPVSLHIHDTNNFIEKLTDRIKTLNDKFSAGKFKSFIEAFGNFDVLQPSSQGVTPEKYLVERVDDLSRAVRRIERSVVGAEYRASVQPFTSATPAQNALLAASSSGLKQYRFLVNGNQDIMQLRRRLNYIKGIVDMNADVRGGDYIITIYVEPLAPASTEMKIHSAMLEIGGSAIL